MLAFPSLAKTAARNIQSQQYAEIMKQIPDAWLEIPSY
jgi:hypothetical protein